MPKLNWSAPKDITWLNEGTTKCGTAGDVYLLLKSSDFCGSDLKTVEGYKGGEGEGKECGGMEYELVLRKWSHLYDSMEFRCFVGDGMLVAVSQRNHTQHFPHLPPSIPTLLPLISTFFHNAILPYYNPGTGSAADVGSGGSRGIGSNYVFDVYIDKEERVWLVDFNVWGVRTDALLFDWEEICALVKTRREQTTTQNNVGDDNDAEQKKAEKEVAEMRVVEGANEVHYDPLSSYRGPIDAVDLAKGEDGALHSSFEEFMRMCERPSDRKVDGGGVGDGE